MNELKNSLTQKIRSMKKWTLLLMALPLFWACRKDDDISYCELHTDECVDVREVKDYFYFKMGSWWVYEEEHSGKRDSVYVYETWTDTSSVLFETWLHSSYDGYDYTFWTTGVNGSLVTNNLTKKTDLSTRVNRAKTTSGDYVDEATCFLFYPKPGLESPAFGGIEYGYKNILKVQYLHITYNISGEIFNNVVEFSEEHTAIEESQPTRHFYCPNIGIIKKELIDSNQVWNLVSYHIEP
jgi:hypothetical protein